LTRRVAARVDEVKRETKRSADLTCALTDQLRGRGLTPALLDDIQTGLRRQTLWVEERLRALRRRKAGRARRLKHRARAKPELKAKVVEHRAVIHRLEQELHLQRSVLRQAADSFAWLVLREEPRLIVPLFAPQSHQLPQGLGLGAPAMIASAGHAAGTLLFIENDLTRCIGVGDLTVVFAERAWQKPLVLEVKATGEWREGAVAEIALITAHSDAPDEIALCAEVTRIIGEQIEPERVHLLERPEQVNRLVSHTKALAIIAGASGPQLPASSRRMWRALDAVVARALQGTAAYDLPESGIAFVAVPVGIGDPARELMRLVAGLRDLGFGRECAAATSGDLQNEDEWAAVVPPIPLWPISRAGRVGVMTAHVYFAAVLKPDVWKQAMADEGLTLEEDDRGHWRVIGPRGEVQLDHIEVRKLCLGVAFTGISPRDVARGLAQHIAELAAVTG
jgi:hypothetical protein